jgi:hypothetical protein
VLDADERTEMVIAYLGRQVGGRAFHCDDLRKVRTDQRPIPNWGSQLPCPSELIAVAALDERSHRSLARRRELWCAAALEGQYLALLRSRPWDLLAKDYAATCPYASSFDVAISARR